MKQSGGYVWAYSEPGQGATFKIYLPRVDSPAETLVSERLDLVFDRGTETVLLAEDDSSLRALTAQMLRGAGYTVLEAADGKAALEIANGHLSSIDMVLTDVIMPGMSGGELIVHLRHLRPERKLAVLFMSGYAGDFINRAGVPESDAEIGCCYENRTELDCSPPSHFGRIAGTALERRCVNRESAILIEAKTSSGKRSQPCWPPRGVPGTFTIWSRPHRGPSAIWSAKTSW